ncbi:MAG: hypothetical protein U9N84_01630, partial [Actinomycetota bacterium]|nr:hypothetical protein [Actinomycetota bacterium]
MSLNTKATIDAIHSHFAASGLFARVHTHEPKNAPDTDMSAALWVGSIGPAPADSGLAASTAVVVYMGRLYIGM